MTLEIFPPLPMPYGTPATWTPTSHALQWYDILGNVTESTYDVCELSVRLFRTKLRYCTLVQQDSGTNAQWYTLNYPDTDDCAMALPGAWWLDPDYRRLYETWSQLTVNDVGRVVELYTASILPGGHNDVVISDVKVYAGRVYVKLQKDNQASWAAEYPYWKLRATTWDEVNANRVMVEKEISAKAVLIDREETGEGGLGSLGVWHPASDFVSAFTKYQQIDDRTFEMIALRVGSRFDGSDPANPFDWDSNTAAPFVSSYSEDEMESIPIIGSFTQLIRNRHMQRPRWVWQKRSTDFVPTSVETMNRRHSWVLPITMPQGAVLERVKVWASVSAFNRTYNTLSDGAQVAVIGAYLKTNPVPSEDTFIQLRTGENREMLCESPGAPPPLPNRESGTVVLIEGVFSDTLTEDPSTCRAWSYNRPVQLDPEAYYSRGANTIDGIPNPWAAECVYEVGDVIIVRTTFLNRPLGGYVYRCTTAGTSHTVEPIWHRLGVQYTTVTEETNVVWELVTGRIRETALYNFHPYQDGKDYSTYMPGIDRHEWAITLETSNADTYYYGMSEFCFDVLGCGLVNDNAKRRIELVIGLRDLSNVLGGELAAVESMLHQVQIYGAEVQWTYPSSELPDGARMSIAENLAGGAVQTTDPRAVTFAQPKRIPLKNYPS